MPSGVLQVWLPLATIGRRGAAKDRFEKSGICVTPSPRPDLRFDPDMAIERLQRRDGVRAGKNKFVDARGAPRPLEFARGAREPDASCARSLERFRKDFRLFRIDLVGPTQADE